MNSREQYENGVLSIRFTGQELQTHGVSIYDLGETLLSIQRIVHKAYLAKEGRLIKGAFPTKEERPNLALQLGERRRSSDAFALLPILADPAVQQGMKQLVEYVTSGIVGYYTGDLLDRLKKEKDENKQMFIGSIHAEVVNIINRVDTVSGVEGITIGSPMLGHETVASFTPETKDYINELKNEAYLGPYKEIQGRVYKLYPASKIIGIRRSGGSTVSVFLSDEDFEKIRYNKTSKPAYKFKGHPMYKFGIETRAISEFQADEIELIEEDEE